MKPFYLILFFVFSLIGNLCSQPTFQRTYPFTDPVVPLNFVSTPDSNFLIYASSADRIFLMKINQSGDTLWTRKYMANFFQIGQLIILQDSGFVITGSWNDEVAVMKINQYGDSLWVQNFSYPNGIGLSIEETDDHGFYLLNSHDDSDIVYYDIQFMKLDSAGNFIWEKSYNLGHDIINLGYLMKLSNTNYLAQIRRAMGGPSSPYGRLLRVDTAGNILSNSPTSETGRRGGDFITQSIDSNFFMIGNTRASWDDDPYGVLYKLNMSGFISSSLSFPGTSAMKSVAADFAGGCMVTCDSFQSSRKEFQLKRFDTNGQLISSNLYPIDHHESANAVHCTPDSGFMIVGYHQLPSGEIETYIVKTDSTGLLNTNGYEIVQSDSFLCEGDSVTLSVQSAVSYLWSDGQTTQSITLTANGSYNVSVVDSLGQTYYTTFSQVIFLPTPMLSLGDDTSFCTGADILLNPGNFSSYLWQDSSFASAFDVTSSGIYSVLVTAFNGCSTSDTIEISVFALPVFSLGNDTSLCVGSTILLHAGTGFENYQWQDGALDSVYAVSVQGNYYVTVTDSNGCSASDTIQLSFNPIPQITLGDDTLLCIDQTILLDAGQNFSNYVWQDGSSMQTFIASSTIADSIIYYVLVTDSNSCVGGDSVMVIYDLCEGITGSADNGILISPNPFDKNIQIHLPASSNDSWLLTIFSANGEQVYDHHLIHDVEIDVSFLPHGIYFLLLRSGTKYILEKAVKVK